MGVLVWGWVLAQAVEVQGLEKVPVPAQEPVLEPERAREPVQVQVQEQEQEQEQEVGKVQAQAQAAGQA